MREFLEQNNGKINEEQARDVLDRCMKLLYYRDGRAYDKVINAFLTILLKLKHLQRCVTELQLQLLIY